MTVTFFTGGARSGKSYAAVHAATQIDHQVLFVATATALDDEMAHRIARHQAERPLHWKTIEEPLDLIAAVTHVPPDTTVIIDCLTLWVTNQLLDGLSTTEIVFRAYELVTWAAGRAGHAFIISNEVGSGIVPLGELTRGFQDALGTVNAVVSNAADRAFAFIAGRPVALGNLNDILLP